MKSSSPIIVFESDTWYTLGELRHRKHEVTSYRKLNVPYSSALRLNELRGSKIWNEELSPFCDLSYCLELPDSAQFRIAPKGNPAIDILLFYEREISIQMTVADMHWGKVKNASDITRWEFEYLRDHGTAFGGGGTRKLSNGDLISEPRAICLEDRLLACKRGMVRVLEQKLRKSPKANWLAIYCRGFNIQLVDGGGDQLEELLLQTVKGCSGFQKVFIFDSWSQGSFFRSWSQSIALSN